MMSKKHTQCFGLLNYNTNLAFTSLKWLCFSGTLQVLAVVLVNSSQPLHPAKVWDHHRALRLPVTSLHLINFEKKGQAPASWKKEDSAKEKHIIYTYIYICIFINAFHTSITSCISICILYLVISIHIHI